MQPLCRSQVILRYTLTEMDTDMVESLCTSVNAEIALSGDIERLNANSWR